MKKVILTLIVLFGLSHPAFAQRGLSVHANANLVQLLFDDNNDYSITDDPMSFWEKFRCAMELKYQYKVIGNLDMYASANLFYKNVTHNPPKDIMKWKDDEILPSNFNIPVMLGLNYSIFNIMDEVSLWIEAGAGFNFRQISSVHRAHTITPDAPTPTESSRMGATTAWKTGIGITASYLSIEIAYSVFGSKEISMQNFANSFSANQHNTSMLFLCIGFHI